MRGDVYDPLQVGAVVKGGHSRVTAAVSGLRLGPGFGELRERRASTVTLSPPLTDMFLNRSRSNTPPF